MLGRQVAGGQVRSSQMMTRAACSVRAELGGERAERGDPGDICRLGVEEKPETISGGEFRSIKRK